MDLRERMNDSQSLKELDERKKMNENKRRDSDWRLTKTMNKFHCKITEMFEQGLRGISDVQEKPQSDCEWTSWSISVKHSWGLMLFNATHHYETLPNIRILIPRNTRSDRIAALTVLKT